ncbi:MAG TPA: Glu/Leu/Phe/Val dehydrogenase [Pirellulaceae bacterium]|nr:Glu/Leu/Phe/Val dehydrogenase [Pirellulaceae bacterium]HMO92832.1 Glu/Leu/Phe/Val dehydrogenase [Pirellulaceae bacterium]HMP69426.1 Glu/Leu/Phe/Val dehydrogenase [Pirellulaceae bacterium]
MSELIIEEAKIQPEATVFGEFADAFGPEKVVYIYEPRCGLKAIVVIHNTSVGPAIGGVRMTPNVTSEEVFRLAEAMTWKNALAGIPHGGGKSGIIADSRKLRPEEKEILIRQFARGIETLNQYIPGPDMGTDETCMAWIRDEIRRSVGLSSVLGGIPLDQIGATGYGLAICGDVIQEFLDDLSLDGARISIQGFGNVGQHAAKYLVERGAILTVATDLDGTIHNEKGIDVDELITIMREKKGITHYPDAKKYDRDEFIDINCDIFVPAAQPDVINEKSAKRLDCKVVLQGANIPCTPEAEQILHDRTILNVPDFVANAGGVICGSVEYHGGSKTQAFAEIEEKMRENTRAVILKSKRENLLPREAALKLARARVSEAMSYRRAN